MKHLIRFAIGAAVAGALVNMLMKRRSRSGLSDDNRMTEDNEEAGTRGFTLQELADTNSVSSGDATADQSGSQPQDWRGAQNVLDS
jgi:hypothetical protein